MKKKPQSKEITETQERFEQILRKAVTVSTKDIEEYDRLEKAAKQKKEDKKDE
jgi:hypothetical protein